MPASPWLVAIVLGVPALVLLAARLLPGASISLRLLQARRDRHGERRATMARATAFHDRLPEAARADGLDDRTWQDLDLDAVFMAVDRTESEPGRQYLYHVLHSPHADRAPLQRLERAVGRVAGDEALASRLRGTLGILGDPRAGQLVNLVAGDLPRRPRFWWIFPLLTAGSLLCLALIAVWPRAIVVWIGICVVNVLVQLVYKPRVKQFIPALHELPAFVRAARTLGTLALPECDGEVRCLREGAARIGLLRRATGWLMMFEPGEANDLAASLYEYVNLLFLLDVNAFVFAIDNLRGSRDVMWRMFEAVGYLDVVQSIAAWRGELPRWTTPEFTEARKALHVEGLVHPLLADPVPNDLDVRHTSVLITGSNMSGKTTFVRAMGVNAVLAQTLHTVCATEWHASMLRVRTSIGRADSLIEGKSYYLAEVESVRALLRAKERGEQHIFLLDEIFRGTNTTERVAAAYAVLSHLTRGDDIVFVATHDIEVVSLLGSSYASHHFREEIVDGALTFDYRIHAGPSSTRNAIRLLEFMEFPEQLVADANAMLDWQRQQPALPLA